MAVVEGGSVRYTPTPGYTGSDTFQYRLSVEFNTPSAAATVTVTVNAASGGGGGGGGGDGGSLDLMLLASLAGAAFRRSRFVLRH
jgi:hypothetical protein